MDNDIIFLPSCAINEIQKTLIDKKYVKLDLILSHPLLEENFTVTFKETFFWPMTYSDNYKAIFNQAINDDINNLPKKISCLINKHPEKIEVIGVGKEHDKVVFNLSEMEYFCFQELAVYAALDNKIPNKEISNKNKNKI